VTPAATKATKAIATKMSPGAQQIVDFYKAMIPKAGPAMQKTLTSDANRLLAQYGRSFPKMGAEGDPNREQREERDDEYLPASEIRRRREKVKNIVMTLIGGGVGSALGGSLGLPAGKPGKGFLIGGGIGAGLGLGTSALGNVLSKYLRTDPMLPQQALELKRGADGVYAQAVLDKCAAAGIDKEAAIKHWLIPLLLLLAAGGGAGVGAYMGAGGKLSNLPRRAAGALRTIPREYRFQRDPGWLRGREESIPTSIGRALQHGAGVFSPKTVTEEELRYY
jgi:hypothetical protein